MVSFLGCTAHGGKSTLNIGETQHPALLDLGHNLGAVYRAKSGANSVAKVKKSWVLRLAIVGCYDWQK
jgi:hypothetical protein